MADENNIAKDFSRADFTNVKDNVSNGLRQLPNKPKIANGEGTVYQLRITSQRLYWVLIETKEKKLSLPTLYDSDSKEELITHIEHLREALGEYGIDVYTLACSPGLYGEI
jgi:hypothetical protein